MAEVEQDSERPLLWRPPKSQVFANLCQLLVGFLLAWSAAGADAPVMLVAGLILFALAAVRIFNMWWRRVPSVALFDDGTARRTGMLRRRSWTVDAKDVTEVAQGRWATATLYTATGRRHPVDHVRSKNDLARIRSWHRRHHHADAAAHQEA